MIKIDVFCESGGQYGLGHLKRCENLILHFQKNYPSLRLEVTFHSLPCSLQEGSFEIVIIDSYIAPLELYENLAKRSKVLLCLDDFSRLAYPSNALILSPTYRQGKSKKRIFEGQDYVILHPAFSAPIDAGLVRENHVLITLGGSDQRSLIQDILASLSSFPNLFFHILSPDAHIPDLDPLRAKSYPLLPPQAVCELIDSCEYIISASGGSLNEALSRKKKVIALCIAKNQKSQLQAYQRSGEVLAIFNPFIALKSKLLHAWERTSHLSPRKISYGRKLPELFRNLLLATIKPSNSKPFDRLNHREKLEILHLRNQPQVREASFHSQIIDKREHLCFFASLNPMRDFYFAFFGAHGTIQGVGYLRFDDSTIGLYRHANSLGWGSKILRSLFLIAEKLDLAILKLEVKKNNSHALSFYAKHHFNIIQEEEHYFVMQRNLRSQP